MKTLKFNSQSAALIAHKEITGCNFYEGFAEQKTDSKEWFVCQESGDIFYIYQTPKDNFCQGEKIFHKLTIHSALSNSGFNQVSIWDGGDSADIHIIEWNWGSTKANRKVFADEKIIVTTLI